MVCIGCWWMLFDGDVVLSVMFNSAVMLFDGDVVGCHLMMVM